MIYVYGDGCWMYENRIANNYHHILKKADGGKVIWDNGALLNRESHDELHMLEWKKRWAYEELNKLFLLVNESMECPSKEHYEEVQYILRLTRTY